MTYNKTKRTLEKASGIIGVVIGAFGVIGALISFVVGCLVAVGSSLVAGFVADLAAATENEVVGLFSGLFSSQVGLTSTSIIASAITTLAIAIVSIVFAAKLIPSPVTPEGVKNRKGAQITHIVFSFLLGNYVSAGLEIGAICMKDFNEEASAEAPKTQEQKPTAEPNPYTKTGATTVEQKIAELKRLKQLGVLDEESYNKSVDKLLNDLKK